MSTLDQGTIQALLQMLADQGNEAKPAEAISKAKQFSSLGFVVVGDGPEPDVGQTLQVPTKAGKVANVVTVQRIDTSPFKGEFGDWAFTYRRLKRGETA